MTTVCIVRSVIDKARRAITHQDTIRVAPLKIEMVTIPITKTKWHITPSLRVATFSHYNKLGQPVLVDADLKTKLCQHGETSSTIRTWLQLEARSRAEGKKPPSRGASKCDCTNTHGLQNRTDTGAFQPPTCVYDVLATLGTKQISVPGETEHAYRLGDNNAFLSANGTIWCGHVNKLPPITSAQRPRAFKAERGKCGCCVLLPGRVSTVPLGRISVEKNESGHEDL